VVGTFDILVKHLLGWFICINCPRFVKLFNVSEKLVSDSFVVFVKQVFMELFKVVVQ